jgi:pimeloyl-ACP methyl ester carboxylesterase
MKKRNSRFVAVLRWIAIALGVVVVLLYLGLPVGIGIVTVLPVKAAGGQPPDGFAEVSLQAEDGVRLTGWYRPPRNGAAILLLHGAGGSKESMRAYAEMLVRQGYGVLALDLRGHGQSQGQTNRLGWQGTLDVGAAVGFLQAQEGVAHIGALGSSMGGEVLLGAASAYPAIEAVVADGATRRSLEEYLALEQNRPLVRNFTARVMFATVQVLSGSQPPLPLLTSMQNAQATRFLLIAAGNNALETSFNQLFAGTLGSRASLWIVPGVDHTGAFARYPDLYEQQVMAFFQSALAG